MVDTCLGRVAPLAERKRIALRTGRVDDCTLVGDRELMEYAVYNLHEQRRQILSRRDRDRRIGRARRRIAPPRRPDQGIGMDQKETQEHFPQVLPDRKTAEASGEKGTGIGLSIVEQIVTHHGGRMEVTAKPARAPASPIVLPATTQVAKTK